MSNVVLFTSIEFTYVVSSFFSQPEKHIKANRAIDINFKLYLKIF